MVEGKIYTIRVYGKGCFGCQKFKADVMLSLQTEHNGDITDLFMNRKQAEWLFGELKEVLDRNQAEEIERDQKAQRQEDLQDYQNQG